MSKAANGSGVIKHLTGRLAAVKGSVLAVAVTLALIAGAGVGFAALRGAPPATSAADAAATASATAAAPGATTPTLGPTLAATATPAPGATPAPTGWAGPPPATPARQPTPPPASGPHLSVIPVMYIQEPHGCAAQYPSYFETGFTVTNAGGGTLTWRIPESSMPSTVSIQLTSWGGSLAAGESQSVQMYWIKGVSPSGPPWDIPPAGSVPFTITSNGGPDQQMAIECAPS